MSAFLSLPDCTASGAQGLGPQLLVCFNPENGPAVLGVK